MVENGVSLSVETIAHALVNIYKGNVDINHEVEEHLYQETSKIFHDAIAEGYANAVENDVPLPDDEYRDAISHSTDVFSAFRVHTMQQEIAAQMIDSEGQLKPFNKFVKDVSPYIEHKNRAWLQTEYNTAVIRAQNAAEWKMFEKEKDVYPNLEWIESTSTHPGEDHRIFWGTIRPVNDPFWDEHRPGDRWNCKCELRQSDSDVTAAPMSDGKSDPAGGLESNPGKDKELFSQKHPYYPQSCMSCPFAGNKLAALFMDLRGKKNCHACTKVDKGIGKRIDNSPNKKVAGEIEISTFIKQHLKPSTTSSNQNTNQKIIKNTDGDELIFRRKFFNETLAKCCRKKNVGSTMQIAFEFEQWAKDLKFIRKEQGIHHNCEFRVYECTYQGNRIELKAKETEGYIAYMIRVY